MSAEQPTALQKLVGTDVRTLATQYGENGVMTEEESDTGYSMNSTMRLKDIVSNANVTYYFAASNYEPIAAVYNTSLVTSQDVSMNISIAGSAGSITVDPFVTETTQDVFLFSGFPMG